MAAQTTHHSIYPQFAIAHNKTPNRFYAVPILGFVVKIIMLIPVFIESLFLYIAFFVLWIINSFVILFTGNYWDTAYDFFLGLMRFTSKISAFIYGLSDTYPGFTLSENGMFTLTIDKPKHPNRLFAIPLIGLLIRTILLIPYYLFIRVMENGSWIAMIISWAPVLFSGKFPQSTYEFEQDTIRVGLSSACYITGLSDKYPSFSISMNHQTIKILLLIAGTLLLVWSIFLRSSLYYQQWAVWSMTHHGYHYNHQRYQHLRNIRNTFPARPNY